MKKLIPVILFFIFGFSGCATSATTYKEALYPKIRSCRTKACLQSYGLRKIYTSKYQDGYIELYKLPSHHDDAYTARQVGHGLMSLATLGLWEIAYYQIEDALEPDTFTVQAIYQSPNVIKEIQIANAAGGLIS